MKYSSNSTPKQNKTQHRKIDQNSFTITASLGDLQLSLNNFNLSSCFPNNKIVILLKIWYDFWIFYRTLRINIFRKMLPSTAISSKRFLVLPKSFKNEMFHLRNLENLCTKLRSTYVIANILTANHDLNL